MKDRIKRWRTYRAISRLLASAVCSFDVHILTEAKMMFCHALPHLDAVKIHITRQLSRFQCFKKPHISIGGEIQ